MMNPVPAPRRGASGCSRCGRSKRVGAFGHVDRRRGRPSPVVVAASMLTTAGFRRSAMSANETAPAGRASDRDPDPSGTATARLIEGVAEDAAVGVIVPATTRPTRKATVAERQTLTARNRRVIVFYYCIEVRLKPDTHLRRTIGASEVRLKPDTTYGWSRQSARETQPRRA